jgi:tetratricopeptide (TPR) repeat protein
LLRAAVSQAPEEAAKYKSAQEGEFVSSAPNRTLRHWAWLLKSLLFWSLVENPRDAHALAKRMQETQDARLNPGSAVPSNRAVSDSVDRGISALGAGTIAEAQSAFSLALGISRDAAIRCFLTAYPWQLNGELQHRFYEACKDPTLADLSRSDCIELEDWLSGATSPSSVDAVRKLKLCLFASYPEVLRQKRNVLAAELLERHGNPDDWPADEALWLSQSILAEYSPVTHPPTVEQRAGAFFKSALRRLEDNELARQAFVNFAEVCQKPGPKNWSWELLKASEKVRPDLDIHIALAWVLCGREKKDDLDLALVAAQEGEEKLRAANLPLQDQLHREQVIGYARASALYRLGWLSGDMKAHAKAEALLKGLLHSPVVGDSTHLLLADLMLSQRRYGEASEILDRALKKWPKDHSDLYISKFWADLLSGKKEDAASLARDVVNRSGESDGSLFVAALGQLLTETGEWEIACRKFLQTNHEYVPYVAMILYASMAAQGKREADSLLQRRYNQIDRSKWKQRLQGGDVTAWREMLIDYYIKYKHKIPPNDIFGGNLESEAAFAASDFRNLPLSRLGMLCEAYFYDALLAKARGDRTRMRESLEKVLRTDQRDYFEHKMAEFLLAREKSVS